MSFLNVFCRQNIVSPMVHSILVLMTTTTKVYYWRDNRAHWRKSWRSRLRKYTQGSSRELGSRKWWVEILTREPLIDLILVVHLPILFREGEGTLIEILSEHTLRENKSQKVKGDALQEGYVRYAEWAQIAGVLYKYFSLYVERARFWIFQMFSNMQNSWKNKTINIYTLHLNQQLLKFCYICFNFSMHFFYSVNYLTAENIMIFYPLNISCIFWG